jgi:hypothetical protein
MMENFSDSYQLCQLIRDESFGWPLQDPDLDADPFNPSHQALDFDLSVFDSTETSLTPSLAALDFSKVSVPDELEPAALGRQNSNLSPKCEEYSQKHTDYYQNPLSIEDPQQFSRQWGYQQSSETRPNESLGEKCEDYHKHTEFYPNPPPLADPQHFSRWGYQQSGDLGRGTYVVQQPVGPGDVITIGIYTRAERAAKIARFRQKRERRNFSKRVLYGSRKRFADSRPRVGGRFVVNENRVIKPKTFLKRGRPRKVPLLPMMNCLAASLLLN